MITNIIKKKIPWIIDFCSILCHFFQMADISFWNKNLQHDAHHVWQSLPPGGNTMRLFKNLFSHYCNIILISVIGVPVKTLFIVIGLYRVQFISSNSIFEKDKGSLHSAIMMKAQHIAFDVCYIQKCNSILFEYSPM